MLWKKGGDEITETHKVFMRGNNFKIGLKIIFFSFLFFMETRKLREELKAQKEGGEAMETDKEYSYKNCA